MKFDPKKMLDDTLSQMQDKDRRYDERRSYGNESDVEDLIHRISRDVEEIRMKNRELNDRISDLEMKFNHLRDMLRNKRY